MKLLSIFWKNIRTVARNPTYFLILIICPVLLILIAGFMLNSIDFKNLNVGLITSDLSYSDSFKNNIGGVSYYLNVPECIADLTNSKINVCFEITSEGGVKNINVYLDNTKKVVDFYIRQFILTNIFQEQSDAFEQTTEQLNTKLNIFSVSISQAKEELANAEIELERQEKVLIDYRKNLSEIRRDFDSAYYFAKSADENISRIENTMNQNANSFNSNLQTLKENNKNLRTQILFLSSFMPGRLNTNDFIIVNRTLNNVTQNLNGIDGAIYNLERDSPYDEISELIRERKEIIRRMEEIRASLDKMDQDIADALESIKAAKERIALFNAKLSLGEKDINDISSKINSTGLNLEFRNAFELSEDPVFASFPLLIALIITFSSLLLSNMFILKQTNQASYLKDIISPTSRWWFTLGDYLVNLFFVSLQIIALYLIGNYWFKFNIMDNMELYFIGLFIGASVFIFLGMCIAYVIKSEGLSTIVSLFILLVCIILSDFLAPASLASPLVRFFIENNPFFILNKLLFEIMLLKKQYGDVEFLFLKLGFFFLVGLLFSYICRKISEKRTEY